MKTVKNEKGMVLLLVLVVVALLTSLITEFAFSTHVDLRLTETFRDRTRAWYLAKGGIQAGRMILQDDRNGYDHPSEFWGIGVPSYAVGEEGVVSISLIDLDARMNLNRIVSAGRQNPNVPIYDSFIRLFDNLGLDNPNALADALVDWIDVDDSPRDEGAESNDYQRLEQPYAAKNDYLDSLDELALIQGFTPEVIRQIAPFVSVFGGEAVNINTAPAEVLMAMDALELIGRAQAEEIIGHRADKPFEQATELNSISGLENVLRTYFTVKSTAFQINSEGWVNDGVRRVTAVVDSDGRNIHYMKVD